MPADARPARQVFRVATRRRGAYDGAEMTDVQLQLVETGALAWSQTFSDSEQAETFLARVEEDLASLDEDTFRRRHGVPTTT